MTDDDRAIASEERFIYGAMILGALPCFLAAVARGGPLDGGASLCLAVSALGVVGLVARGRKSRERRVPPARMHRR